MNIRKLLLGVGFSLVGGIFLSQANAQNCPLNMPNPSSFNCSMEQPFGCLEKDQNGCCTQYGCQKK